jgi:hypothetical protein
MRVHKPMVFCTWETEVGQETTTKDAKIWFAGAELAAQIETYKSQLPQVTAELPAEPGVYLYDETTAVIMKRPDCNGHDNLLAAVEAKLA